MLSYRQLFAVFLLIILLLPGIGLAQEAPREPYISENGNLALSYPTGWSITEEGGVIWLTSSPYDADNALNNQLQDLLSDEAALVIFPPYLAMPMLANDTAIASPADVVDFMIEQTAVLESETGGAEITEQGDVALNEQPASYVIMREEQTEIFVMALQMVDTGQNYTLLIGYTRLGGMERYRATFLEIASSITFTITTDEVYPITSGEFDAAAFPAPTAGEGNIRWQLQTEGIADAGTFVEPGGLAVGIDDTLYVADLYHGVIVLSPDGVVQDVITAPEMTGAADVLAAPDGSLWVADGAQAMLHHFNPDGSLITSLNLAELDEASITSLPAGQIALDPEGNLVLFNQTFTDATTSQSQLLVISPDGSLVNTISLESATWPHLAIDERGNFYLMELDGNLTVLDSSGSVIEDRFAADVLSEGSQAFALDNEGNFLVGTPGGTVYSLDAGGAVLGQFGEAVSVGTEAERFAPGQFYAPRDIVQLSDGELVVLDSNGGYIQLVRFGLGE